MAAYHKVEVSLNTNAVEVGIPSPQTVNVVVPTIGPAGPVGSVGPVGPTGPQGVPGTGLEVLTTQGDLLYQGASTGQRLAIGTSGQVLKVANGIPAWGNESGAVTSVNGETGAVSLSAADVGAAAASHTHDGTDVFLTDDEAYGPVLAQSFAEGRNGIYWPTDLTINSKPVYKLNRTYGMFFENLRWHIFENSPLTANIVASSADDDEPFPHQTTWSGGDVQRANVANFGERAAQQFQFVGDVQRVGTSSGLPLKTGSGGEVEAGAFGTGAGQFAEGSDPRFSDSRQPTLHGSSHHTGGTDALAAHQINGQTIFSVASVNYSADQTLPANRARQITISNSNAGGITVTLPTQAEGTLVGDTYVIVGGSTMSGPITVRGVANLSPLVYNTLVTITATGQQYRLRSGGGSSGNWSLIPVDTHTHTGAQVTVGATANLPLRTGTNGVVEVGAFGTAAGSFCAGDDVRLSDARTPSSTLAHKASHATGGTDALAPSDIGAQSIFVTEDLGTITANVTLTAARAKIYTVTVNTFDTPTPNVQLPTTNVQAGDVVQIRFTTFTGRAMPVRNGNGSFLGSSLTNGQRATYIAASTSNDSWAEDGTNRHTHAASDITSGTLVHERGGLEADVSAYNGLVKIASGSTSAVTVTTAGEALLDDADAAAQRTTLGAAASGSITTSGLTQATARILGRTSASTGSIEEIQIGSGLSLSAGELSATGSGVTAVGTTLADILSVSGSDLVADDLAADKLYGWDDSESKAIGFVIGSGLSVSGDTLSATASGGSKTYAVFTASDNQPPAAAFATLDTRNSIAVLDFDAATDESAVFVGVIPEGASLGSGLKVFIHWMASTATSGNCRWGVQFEKSGTDLDTDSFDTATEAHSAANGTSGIETVTEITATAIDSLAAGNRFRLKVFRNADDATNDTMTGDAELIAVEIRSAA